MIHSIFYPESKTSDSRSPESIRPSSLSRFGCPSMGSVGVRDTLQGTRGERTPQRGRSYDKMNSKCPVTGESSKLSSAASSLSNFRVNVKEQTALWVGGARPPLPVSPECENCQDFRLLQKNEMGSFFISFWRHLLLRIFWGVGIRRWNEIKGRVGRSSIY